jgi:hypothetical protein
MKQITPHDKETEIVILSEQQQRKEIKLIGRQNKIPGLTLWEFNESTKMLNPASFKPESVFISSCDGVHDTTRTYSVITNPQCIYFQALNKKNAERKLRRAKLLNP